MTQYLNLALLDTMADWEVGYLTAYTGKTEHQRQPGAVALRTVGLTADPVRTVGGLTIVPDVTIEELDPADSAVLVLPGADTWAEPRAAGLAGAGPEVPRRGRAGGGDLRRDVRPGGGRASSTSGRTPARTATSSPRRGTPAPTTTWSTSSSSPTAT